MADNEAVDRVISSILSPIMKLIEWIIEIIFSSKIMIALVFIIMVNAIAIILMKKDKEYAENGERRIREMTLLIVALIGGSFGMYFAMFKYKHKTLHKKFSIGVPVIIVIQCAYLAYLMMNGILL